MNPGVGVRIGVVFPQGSVPAGADGVREYVLGVQELGYDHLVVPDHVLGVDPSQHPGWTGPYDVSVEFHEPMVLFGFLAAISTLELVAGVLVLPQRPTALVAKQAAEVFSLSGERLRLGVGVGWNAPEFEGLGAVFDSRGQRLDEQIVLLRRLWSERDVSFTGSFHSLRGVGIAPLPPRAIPLWVGAEKAPRALRRVGELGDGWMSMGPPVPKTAESIRIIREAAERSDRDPDAIGLQAWVSIDDGDLARATAEIDGWRAFGATHIALSTRSHEPSSLRRHLDLAAQGIGLFS